jgi:replication factor A1
MSVRLTLWGRQAENFTAAGGFNEDGSPQQPVIAFKAVRVGDFGGRSLSMVSSSSMTVDPDIPEAHALRGWYDNQGEATNFTSFNSMGGAGAGGAGSNMKLDEFKLIGNVKEEMLGTGDQPDQFWVRAHLVYIKKENISYPACPTPKCAKKMFQEDQNSWRCEKCEKTFPEPEYR